ncbi:hypothetical protein QWY84_16025 [Aquisalimonas lutea]|nr:hypothetical protein [Aquisalimonas lutea]MDN3519123.1 hypothetical protein [Aquisalimonas lutea]
MDSNELAKVGTAPQSLDVQAKVGECVNCGLSAVGGVELNHCVSQMVYHRASRYVDNLSDFPRCFTFRRPKKALLFAPSELALPAGRYVLLQHIAQSFLHVRGEHFPAENGGCSAMLIDSALVSPVEREQAPFSGSVNRKGYAIFYPVCANRGLRPEAPG